MYSQYEEDSIFLPLLAEVTTKRLLEIGAWDPKDKSNSRALIEAGWDAVLIEPSPGPQRNLIREYGKSEYVGQVTVVGAAVTVHGGLVRLLITDDAVTTPATNVEHAMEWAATGGYFGALTVPSIAVADLFNQFGGDFEMVSIDTEGTSTDIFAEMMLVGPRPRIIVLEHDGRHVEIAQIAEAAHYQQVHLNGTNVILRWTGKRE